MKESQLDNLIKNWCKDNGFKTYKIMGAQFQEKGIPDIIGVYKSVFIALENKVGKNKTSEVQNSQLRQLRESGAIALIIHEDY